MVLRESSSADGRISQPSTAEASAEAVGREQAAAVGLRYVSDRRPGITRHQHRWRGFQYRDAAGRLIRDAATLERVQSLAVPPAWTDVWICPDPQGHLQATGRDARGRKQYRYHADWRAVRDQTKFDHMLVFGSALPRLRRRVAEDLALPGLPREKVQAAVVRLMELTLARIGNVEYAEENHSFGLTTLQNRHVRIRGGQIELNFSAKSGQRHYSVVTDRKLAQILKRCRELPGSELFQYVDESGTRHSIDSSDVNEYLRAISGEDITAKDFRTWAATNLALIAILACATAPNKRQCADIVRQVAEKLGNTPTVCRKSYIHPRVLTAYLDGSLAEPIRALGRRLAKAGATLEQIERFAIKFLGTEITRAE